MPRPLTFVLLLAAIAALPLIAGCRGASQDGAARAADPIPAQVAAVNTATISQWSDAPGTVSAEYQATISTRIAERVDAVMVREGDPVRAGQVLVRLDTRDVDAALSQATANMDAASDAYQSAGESAKMTAATTAAQVAAANAQVAEATAALASAVAKEKRVDAGPRPQEQAQTDQAVVRAAAAFDLSKKTYGRMQQLYDAEAITRQQIDNAKSDLDSAQATYESALEAQSMSREGSRAEDRLVAEADVKQAQAALARAQAGLTQARAETLQVSVLKAATRQAQAQVEQARAGLEVAQTSESYTTISAPFSGIVTERLVDPGVMAGSGVPLLKIEGGRLRLSAAAPESDSALLHVGDRIPVAIDAIHGKSIQGTIETVSPEADPASHTVLVKVALPVGSGALSGMFGRARIRTGSVDACLIPASAVIDREGLDYVYVVTAGRAVMRFVTTGQEIGGRVEILSGLQTDDKIAVSDVGRLADNAPVSAIEGRP